MVTETKSWPEVVGVALQTIEPPYLIAAASMGFFAYYAWRVAKSSKETPASPLVVDKDVHDAITMHVGAAVEQMDEIVTSKVERVLEVQQEHHDFTIAAVEKINGGLVDLRVELARKGS